MATVYAAASEAKNAKAAAVVISQRSKTWAQAYKVYAKALNQCLMNGVPASPTTVPATTTTTATTVPCTVHGRVFHAGTILVK